MLKTTSFDKCLVFFDIPSRPIALHLKNKYRLPYIVRFGGGDIPRVQKRFKYIYKILLSILRKVWKNTDNLIANSEGLYTRALKFESRYNINIIENGVDNQFFILTEESRDINQVRILFMSRLIEGKGLQYIIPHMSRIHEEVFQKCKKMSNLQL